MQMIGAENEALDGYGDWSQELEQGTITDTPHGPILINRDCAHKECTTTRCMKGATAMAQEMFNRELEQITEEQGWQLIRAIAPMMVYSKLAKWGAGVYPQGDKLI